MKSKHTNNLGTSKMKVIEDLAWSIAALVIMNGIIQIVIYPVLNRRLGTEQYGNVLYLISVVSIFSTGVGMALSNVRLLRQRRETAGNGDYLLVMLLFFLPSVLALWVMAQEYVGLPDFVLLVLLMAFMTLRYYSDAEYRLSLNYRRYFVYYLILSIGYLLGLLLWDFFPVWMVPFLLGEIACVAFCIKNGKIYHPMRCTSEKKQICRLAIQLAPSYLLYNLVVQMDRIMLRTFIDSSSVTIYYVASLLGKVIALLVGPLNSIIVSYTTKASSKLHVKTILVTVCSFLLLSAMLFCAVCFISPYVIRLLYGDIYDAVMEISIWANLSQIVCFSASLILTLLLTIAPVYWQMIIQASYALIFFTFGYVGIQLNELHGFVYMTLLANIIRLVLTFIILIIYALKMNPERKGHLK